jgi:hypothetical protein
MIVILILKNQTTERPFSEPNESNTHIRILHVTFPIRQNLLSF